MIGASTIINPILKVVTTVAILGAVYLFILRPVLDTTENISGQVGNQIRQSTADADARSEEFDLSFSHEKAQKLGDCVSGAVGDVAAIQKCMNRFSP